MLAPFSAWCMVMEYTNTTMLRLFTLRKAWSFHVDVDVRLKILSYCEVTEGKLSEIGGHVATPDVADNTQWTEQADVGGTCVCLLRGPTWFGSFGCSSLHHLVFLLYEMARNTQTLGLRSNYFLLHNFALPKQVSGRNWLYGVCLLCPFQSCPIYIPPHGHSPSSCIWTLPTLSFQDSSLYIVKPWISWGMGRTKQLWLCCHVFWNQIQFCLTP